MESRKDFRDDQLPDRNLWDIEGWVYMKMGKYDSQYSSNDLNTADGFVARIYSGLENQWSPVFLRINGWTLNFWENIETMKGHLAGLRECKPVGWIDTRRAHGVSLERVFQDAPLTFQVSLHCLNGHLRFRVKAEEEAERWINALKHIVYDRSIWSVSAQDTEEKKRRRFAVLTQMLKASQRSARDNLHVVHYEQAMQLFRLYDDDQSGHLEIGELLLMVKEMSTAR